MGVPRELDWTLCSPNKIKFVCSLYPDSDESLELKKHSSSMDKL